MKNDYSAQAMLAELVRFDTTSRDGNIPLIEFVENYLDSWDVPHFRVDYEAGKKTNLFATIGPDIAGGIVLSGHTDVVPVDGQAWASNPFELSERGGRLYGRGTCDMKGFVACVLGMVPDFKARTLKTPLHVVLSYDEEVGCVGVRRLIADLPARGIAPAGCIVGEPTGMRLVVAHKGKKSWRCRVRGHEAHSSLTPRGVNAVQIACEIVAHIAAMARRFRDGSRRDEAYDVPYTTLHVGTIRGGTALNIVPRDCEFVFEVRHLPFDDPDALFAEIRDYAQTFVPAMRAVATDAHIAFDALSTMPGFDTQDGSAIADLGHELCCADAATFSIAVCPPLMVPHVIVTATPIRSASVVPVAPFMAVASTTSSSCRSAPPRRRTRY